jgi:hypothetical protein
MTEKELLIFICICVGYLAARKMWEDFLLVVFGKGIDKWR